MRRILISLVAAFTVLLVSCASAGQAEISSYSYSILDKAPATGIPFKEDAVAVAKKTGTMRFYFMCGDGLLMSANDGTKWGDSTLVVFPDGQTMLIDGGMAAYADRLVENLKALGIMKLDYVVLSHNHPDHFGGLVALGGVFETFPVGTFIWSGLNCDSYNAGQGKRFQTGLDKLTSNTDTKVEIVREGDSFDIGDVKVEIFNPSQESIEEFLALNTSLQSERHNSESIVMKFTFNEFSALFCGDLYQDREEKLVEKYGNLLDVDMVKANHHGKDTSNGVAWAQATTPRVVVAMYGYQMAGTAYGNYAATGSRVFCEFFDGYIRVVTSGQDACAVTAAHERTTILYAYYDMIAKQVIPEE